MDLGTIFPVLTVFIGAACILLIVSTKTLRDSRDDQEKRITFLEAENTRIVAESDKKDAAIEVLRQSMTGEVHLVALTDLAEHISRALVALTALTERIGQDLDEHHAEAVSQWGSVTKALGTVAEKMDKVGR